MPPKTIPQPQRGATMSHHNGDDPTREELEAAQLTAYALGQLEGEELAAVEARLRSDPALRDIAAIKDIATAVSEVRNSEPMRSVAPGLRESLNERLAETEVTESPAKTVVLPARKKAWWR